MSAITAWLNIWVRGCQIAGQGRLSEVRGAKSANLIRRPYQDI
jgi:hypothetical protein